MTLALAFECANGIVLCADTQMTSPDGFKFQESKMLCPGEMAVWPVFGTYAGNPKLAHAVERQLLDWLFEQSGTAPDHDKFEKGLQTVLNRVCSKERGNLQMVWILRAGDIFHAYRVDRRTITDMIDHELLGVGDSSLVRFLMENLSTVPVRNGIRAAHYIVEQAKQYVDGVGGRTEFIVMYRNGRVDSFHDPDHLRPRKFRPPTWCPSSSIRWIGLPRRKSILRQSALQK